MKRLLKKCLSFVLGISLCLLSITCVSAEEPIEKLKTITQEQYLEECNKINQDLNDLKEHNLLKSNKTLLRGNGIVYRVTGVNANDQYHDPYHFSYGKYRFVNNSSGILTGIYKQTSETTKSAQWSATISASVKAQVIPKIIEAAGEISTSLTTSYTVSKGTEFGAEIEVQPHKAVMLELKYAGVNIGGTYTVEVTEFGEYKGSYEQTIGNNWLIDDSEKSIIATDIK